MFHVKHKNIYDVLVVGAGHAGIEAATMSSRLGQKTAIITFNPNDIGALSCNPAMGGLGKGHLIREIDALGGLIGRASDLSGIQFRVLNRTRGEAVQGPRAQIDRAKYKKNISNLLKKEKISVLFDEVVDINLEIKNSNKKITGLKLKNLGSMICKAIVITTGTFMRGTIYQGERKWPAGRIGAEPSIKLANFFKKNNFKLLRLKTGTPPRLVSASINYKKCEKQEGDLVPQPFSFLTKKITNKQVECHITYTNKRTHDIIKDNLDKSPIFNGQIKSKGPRYCPSLEDKVHRFEAKERHQIFLEPESLDSDVIYPNGISTSLPVNIQEKLLRTINGLEDAEISQYGYTIEYDCIDSSEINHSYESLKIDGLYLAGQINGTTGYEEAAAQGLLAGINAARKINGDQSIVIPRSQGYLGVLTSDLVRGGLIEPYRMFTSRAEYRLLLRADNADERLTDLAIKLGTAEPNREKKWKIKKKLIQKACIKLEKLKASPQEYLKFNIKINQDGRKRSAYEILGYKSVSWSKLQKMWPELRLLKVEASIQKQIKINSFYKRYSERQLNEVNSLEKDKYLSIRKTIDYKKCSGLSNEVKEILAKHKPKSIKEARELPGMTPAAASILLRYVKK